MPYGGGGILVLFQGFRCIISTSATREKHVIDKSHGIQEAPKQFGYLMNAHKVGIWVIFARIILMTCELWEWKTLSISKGN
jgi:hypothetical protein